MGTIAWYDGLVMIIVDVIRAYGRVDACEVME